MFYTHLNETEATMKNYLYTTHVLILLFIFTIFILPTRFTFLSWNIILATIPFDIALLIQHLFPKHKILTTPLVLIWLIFYPNAIYMITDFAHLSAIGTGLTTSTQILNYGLLASGIFLGVFLGIVSARTIIQTLFPNSSYYFKLIIFTGISIASSYAIYVGRFLRFNSWDIFLDVHTLFAQMHAAFSIHALHFIVVFTLVQIFLMLTYVTLTAKSN